MGAQHLYGFVDSCEASWPEKWACHEETFRNIMNSCLMVLQAGDYHRKPAMPAWHQSNSCRNCTYMPCAKWHFHVAPVTLASCDETCMFASRDTLAESRISFTDSCVPKNEQSITSHQMFPENTSCRKAATSP